MMTDPISDLLTRLRNAYMVGKTTVEVPASKIKFSIVKILEVKGYLAGVEEYQDGPRKMLRVTLKYGEADQPAITEIRRVSKPGRRVYRKATELFPVRSGFGMAIISTPNGLMTTDEARKRSLGGEVICELF